VSLLHHLQLPDAGLSVFHVGLFTSLTLLDLSVSLFFFSPAVALRGVRITRSYCYVCVLVLLYMCPSYYYIFPADA
jgi:hypothetical protein